jgi:flagellar motor switch protein FliM
MSNSPDILTRETIQQLLRSIGTKSGQVENIPSSDYNFRQPHYFNSKQLNSLVEAAAKLSGNIAEKFASFFNTPFDVRPVSVSQHYAGILFRQADSKADVCNLIFKDKQNKSCGIVTIPRQAAALWLSILLGESENPAGSSVALSQFEQSLLFDMTAIFVRAFAVVDNRCDFQPAGKPADGPAHLELPSAEELCKITFELKKSGSEDFKQVDIVISSQYLAPLAGKITSAKPDAKPQDNKKIITEHLNDITIPVTICLGSAHLNFEQIMTLQPDDVILLDKKINRPAELVLLGKKIFEGKLAKVAAKKAFVVTSTAV